MDLFDRIDKEYAYDGSLGALYSKESTEFRLWAPLADSVTVRLYHTCRDEKPFRKLPMTRGKSGVWLKTAYGNLDGIYYTYLISNDKNEQETIDIYAKSAGVNGAMGLIFDSKALNPKGWDKQPEIRLENYTDACIYELHVRDFSIDGSGKFCYRGRFLAFIEKGLVNAAGDSIGIDHLKELGITHVQLLPVFDYHTVNEADFHRPQFNWGYDPMNYNVPEGSYSTDPYNGKTRVSEFKRLVYALHNAGIGVIMDVVYNHTFATADSAFTLTFPKYYYRQWGGGEHYANGSGCGNEVATERRMVRKYIIDSLVHWMTEYKLDGFRFDLMGLYDIETMNEISRVLRRLNPDVMLYGEGWTGGDSPYPYEKRAMKLNACHTPDFAFFSDDFRDTVKGSSFHNKDKGYINGRDGVENYVREIISGRVPHPQLENLYKYSWTKTPAQTINYVEVHDNLTLWDKLHYTNSTDSEEIRIKLDKMCAAMVFLSQGIPLIQAGQEFLRSKPLTGGNVFDHNSYKSPDAVNSIKWNRKTEYKSVFEYYRGLIALRKEHSAFRMVSNEDVCGNLKFFDNLPKKIVGFVLYNDNLLSEIIVFFNPNGYAAELFAFGEYGVYADGEYAGASPIRTVEGKYTVDAYSVIVLGKK